MSARALIATVVALVLAAAAPASADVVKRWAEPGPMALSPDGRNLYAAGSRTITFAIDPATRIPRELSGLEPGGTSIVISPDGRFVYVGATGIHILTRDPVSGLLLHTDTATATGPYGPRIRAISALAMTADGRRMYATRSDGPAVLVLDRDVTSGELSVRQILHGGTGGPPNFDTPLGLALAPDESSLYVATTGGVVALARSRADGTLTALSGDPLPSLSAAAVAVSPDGRRVYAAAGEITTYDRVPATGALTELARTDAGPAGCLNMSMAGRTVSVAPDSRLVLSGQDAMDRLVVGAVAPGGVEPVSVFGGLPDLGSVGGMVWASDSLPYVASGPRKNLTPCTVNSTLRGEGNLLVLRRSDGELRHVTTVKPVVQEPPLNARAAVTINAGALYTNDPEVTVHVTAPYWGPASLTISNDGGFADGSLLRASPDGTYRWRLAATGPQRTVRRVYVRFTGAQQFGAQALSDDIIVDQRPPTIQSVRLLSPRRLTLTARDDRSGVAGTQLAGDRGHPQRTGRYRPVLTLPAAKRPTWVRVIDGAGNRSRWRRIARRASPHHR